MAYGYNSTATEELIGAVSPINGTLGFKSDVAQIASTYAAEGVNIMQDMGAIAQDESRRNRLVDLCCESIINTDALNEAESVNDPYLSTYCDRYKQYLDNSLVSMARESVMTAYAPIQSYAPFMLKRQWVSCVWKDVLNADIAKSNIVRLSVEERYIVDGSGVKYQVPDVYYNKELMQHLINDATGISLKEDAIPLPLQHVCLIDPTKNKGNTTVKKPDGTADDTYEYYSEPLVIRDARNTMTHDYTIFKVIFKDSKNNEHAVFCDIKPDLATHTLINGNNLKCTVLAADGSVEEVLTDDITGNVDFETGTVSVFSTRGSIVKICHRGKAANRWNHRSLTTLREVKPLTFYMPESGPRLNAAITVEEAQDAISTANIDLYADNVDMMGDALANIMDFQIKTFAMNSYDNYRAMETGPLGYEENFTEYGSFDAEPNALAVGITINEWMNQSKEYFERFLDNLLFKLKTADVTIKAVCHPKLVRYLRTDVKWIFDDQTDVSGVKLQHKIGISTQDGKRIHLITSTYMSPNDGVYVIIIPNTTEAITMKHIMHSAIIDKGYQNPLEPLVPNVMCTQRSLTFEVTPVQGFFEITGRGTVAPSTHAGYFNVKTTATTTTTTPGSGSGTSSGGTPGSGSSTGGTP